MEGNLLNGQSEMDAGKEKVSNVKFLMSVDIGKKKVAQLKCFLVPF